MLLEGVFTIKHLGHIGIGGVVGIAKFGVGAVHHKCLHVGGHIAGCVVAFISERANLVASLQTGFGKHFSGVECFRHAVLVVEEQWRTCGAIAHARYH